MGSRSHIAALILSAILLTGLWGCGATPSLELAPTPSTRPSSPASSTSSGLPSATTSLTAAYMGGEIPRDLSPLEREQLDALDAPGVIRTYLETIDFAVVYYLSAPPLQSTMTDPGYVGEQRHEGDISHLVLDGPRAIFLDPLDYSKADWPIQEQYVITYDLLVARQEGIEEPGPQVRFVYVGRQTPGSVWKILGVGTGP